MGPTILFAHSLLPGKVSASCSFQTSADHQKVASHLRSVFPGEVYVWELELESITSHFARMNAVEKGAQVKAGEQIEWVFEVSSVIILAFHLLWPISTQSYGGKCLTTRLSEGGKKALNCSICHFPWRKFLLLWLILSPHLGVEKGAHSWLRGAHSATRPLHWFYPRIHFHIISNCFSCSHAYF